MLYEILLLNSAQSIRYRYRCYRNKYREGGDCLDIEDRGWVV